MTSKIKTPWACSRHIGIDATPALDHCKQCQEGYRSYLDGFPLDDSTARDVVRRNALASLRTAYDLLCCLVPEEAALCTPTDLVDRAIKKMEKVTDEAI